MCMFCVAIPATAAVGANLNSKAKHEEIRTSQKVIISSTAGIIILLVAASAVYHTQLSQ